MTIYVIVDKDTERIVTKRLIASEEKAWAYIDGLANVLWPTPRDIYGVEAVELEAA